MAFEQAQQSNGQEVKIADREGAGRTPVWSVVTVKGSAGLQAIKLQVSHHIDLPRLKRRLAARTSGGP
jgi:hypothetical protein